MKCFIADQKTQGHYFCTREAGHDGPCAAVPKLTPEDWAEAQKHGNWIDLGLYEPYAAVSNDKLDLTPDQAENKDL